MAVGAGNISAASMLGIRYHEGWGGFRRIVSGGAWSHSAGCCCTAPTLVRWVWPFCTMYCQELRRTE
jgi:hypothetical protein